MRPLEHVPAVVDEPAARARRVVDLLPVALSDVADVEVAGESVERVPPRVAQAEGGDLRGGPRLPDVEAHHLPEQALHVLGAVLRVAARAAVPHAHPQEPVRPECEVAAVVVGVRVVVVEQLARRRGQRSRPVRLVADDASVSTRIGVVDVDEAVRGVLRVEGEPEQPLLPAGLGEVSDVEEESGSELSALHDPNGPALLDDVEPPRLAARGRHVDGLDQSTRDDRAPEGVLGAECRARGACEHDGREDSGQQDHQAHRATVAEVLLTADESGEQRYFATGAPRSARRRSIAEGLGTTASTSSPGLNTVEGSPSSFLPSPNTEMRREPSGSTMSPAFLPAAGEPASTCTSTTTSPSSWSSSSRTSPCSGTSCSTRPRMLVVAQSVWVTPSRSKCCWLRGSLTRATAFGTP